MCGRFTLHHSTEQIAARFAAQKVLFEAPPRFNIAPSQDVAAITVAGPNAERRLENLRWGLVPFWAKDASIGNRMINARAETLAEKPAFKYALSQRRCLIPADGFYEWKGDAGSKNRQPMHIRLREGELFAFAGLWEEWRPKDQPEAAALRSFTIVTTTPNKLLATMHHRMAVILKPEDEATWLDPNLREADDVLSLLQPYSDEAMEAWPVSTKMNAPAYDAPDCIAPMEEEAVPSAAQGSLF